MKQKIIIPYEFILDCLHPKEVKIKPMFGCFGLYIDDKVIFLLRDREEKPLLNGVWIAVSKPKDYESLAKELPSINQEKKLVEDKKSNKKWLLLSAVDNQFESSVNNACDLILDNDKRIGKKTKSSLM